MNRQCLRTIWRRLGLAALSSAALVASLAGCSGDGQASRSSGPGRPLANFHRAIQELTSTDHGLEVITWNYDANAAPIGSLLAASADGAALDRDALRRLRNHGVRLVRVPIANLDALRDEMGEPSMSMSTWHGEAVNWRSILERPVPEQGIAVAMDGRVRSFRSGKFRIMLRSWTIQMEDGPVVHLELLPQYVEPTMEKRRLMGQTVEFRGEHFQSMVVDAPLEAGYAYILTGEAPAVDWLVADSEFESSADSSPIETDQSTSGGASDDEPQDDIRFPSSGAGPVVDAPHSFGEQLFLFGGLRQRRTLLVLIPRVPSELYPPELRSTAQAGAPSR